MIALPFSTLIRLKPSLYCGSLPIQSSVTGIWDTGARQDKIQKATLVTVHFLTCGPKHPHVAPNIHIRQLSLINIGSELVVCA